MITNLVVNTLYKIKKNQNINGARALVVVTTTGAPSVSYGFYDTADGDTFPATVAELASDNGVDSKLSTAGQYDSFSINNYDYIGFTGTGTVKIRNVELEEVA